MLDRVCREINSYALKSLNRYMYGVGVLNQSCGLYGLYSVVSLAIIFTYTCIASVLCQFGNIPLIMNFKPIKYLYLNPIFVEILSRHVIDLTDHFA